MTPALSEADARTICDHVTTHLKKLGAQVDAIGVALDVEGFWFSAQINGVTVQTVDLSTLVRPVAQLLAGVTLFPQTLINVRLHPGQDWKSNTRMQEEVQKAEAELGETGRVLIRASGTEPLVRVMVEARDEARANACARRIADTLCA